MKRSAATRLCIESLERRVLLSAATASVTLLHSFTGGSDAANPGIIGTDQQANLYGMSGTIASLTAVFRISPAGAFSVLHSFSSSDHLSGVGTVDPSGNFFGAEDDPTTHSGTLFEIPAGSSNLVTIHRFAGITAKTPAGIPDLAPNSLISDGLGNVYGTTSDTLMGVRFDLQGCCGHHQFWHPSLLQFGCPADTAGRPKGQSLWRDQRRRGRRAGLQNPRWRHRSVNHPRFSPLSGGHTAADEHVAGWRRQHVLDQREHHVLSG